MKTNKEITLEEQDVEETSNCEKNTKDTKHQLYNNFQNVFSANYIKNVQNIKKLSKEEELALWKKISEWDQKALQELIVRSLRLVIMITKKYHKKKYYRNLWLHDLIQEWNIWVIIAAQKFDYTKGCSFKVYAKHWIKNNIQRANNHNNTIKIPPLKNEEIKNISKAKEELFKKLNRYPSIEEISEYTNIEIEEIYLLSQMSQIVFSLEHDITNSEELPWIKLIETIRSDTETPEQVLESTEKSKNIEESLKHLREKERIIISKHFGLCWHQETTLADIGRQFWFTKERARQIENNALRKLKKIINYCQ